MICLRSSLLAASAFAFGLACAHPSTAAAQDVAVPPVTIEGIEASGTGCPQGSVIPLPIDSDAKGQALTIKLTAYNTYVDSKKALDQKACELKVYVKVPAGKATAVASVIYRGIANLDQGVSGELGATYRWFGRPVRARSSTPKRLTGFKGPFELADKLEGNVTSECGGEEELVISTNLNLRNSTPRRVGELKLERAELDLTSSITIKFDTVDCQ